MRICLVSSSYYPATFYGAPVSATWDLSHKLASLIQNNMNLDIVTKSKPTQPKLSMDQSDFLKYKNKLDDIIMITSTYRSIQDND